MTDTNDLAARLYPDLRPSLVVTTSEPAETESPPPTPDKADLAVTEPETLAGASYMPDESTEPDLSVDDLVGAELSMAERLYGDGSVRPDSPEGYSTVLDERFEHLERQARIERDEDAQRALSEGRTEAAALMHEWQVPREEAGALVRKLGDWHSRAEDFTEDQLEAQQDRVMGDLRALWGGQTKARIELAQRTARDACTRLPWLAEMLEGGAGNDPEVVKAFAEIGLRKARRARRAA